MGGFEMGGHRHLLHGPFFSFFAVSVTCARGVSWPIYLVFPTAGSANAYPLLMVLEKR